MPFLLRTGSEGFEKVQLRRKKSIRSRGASRASASEALLIKDSSCVARMLSSPDTLIFMCMRKDKYDRAYQVLADNATAGQATGLVASITCSVVEHM